MNVLLAQIILVAQGEDMGKWTNILFVIVLAIFWAVGGIIKARAKKPQGEEEKEGQLSAKRGSKLREVAGRIERELSQLSRDRVYGPPERTRGPQREASREPSQAGIAAPAARTRYGAQAARRPRAVARPQAAGRGRRVPAPAFGLPEEPDVSRAMPEFEAGIEELPEYTSQAVEGLQDKYAHISAEEPAADSALQPLLDLDYADTDELRRAILHYEILGKPLAVRDPAERIMGF